ncbi:MAG: glycosyl hydrolase, partial [Actinomycetota bacterium]|nr:glycosyl hydrolase [Actinomycetota bacterium]
IETYFVVLQTPAWAGGAADAPPPPGPYGDFMRRLAEHFRGRVSAYEVWNEPDFPAFWRGGASPAAYAALLRSAYAGVKTGDPGARVGVGGLVGNDYLYVSALYAAGAGGSFDFVSLHTDNDCNRDDPRQAIRDVDGRIARFSFTAYREVRQVMLDHGDDKPIWMTELGWSVARGRCPANRRMPAGVSPGRQAAFLTRAYACLAADPYVEKASWFSLGDFAPEDAIATRFGLLTFGGRRRLAFAAFQRARRVAPNRRCGLRVDRAPPRVTLFAPRESDRRSHDLYYRATARDASGVTTLTLLVDGRRVRVTGRSRLVGHWGRGWRALANGPHTVRVTAVDRAHNVGSAAVTVVKAA